MSLFNKSPKYTAGYSTLIDSIGIDKKKATYTFDGAACLTNICIFDFNIPGSYIFAIDTERHKLDLVQTVDSEKVHEVCALLPPTSCRYFVYRRATEERVLDRIIAYTCYSNDTRRLAEFKRLLPLAAVNRLWRQLACAHIYSTIVIECQSTPILSPKPEPKLRSKAMGVVVWNRPDKTGALPLTKTTSSSATGITMMAISWKTNLALILGREPSRLTTRLCIQAFDTVPDYSTLLDTLSSGFGRHQWTDITHIDVRDYSGLRRNTQPDSAVSAAINSSTSSRSSSSTSLSPMAAAARIHRPSQAHVNSNLTKLATLISKHAPNVTAVASEPWECSPSSRLLAGHLASTYYSQLQVCNAPIIAPIARPKDPCSCNLTSLSIQTSILQSSGPNIIPATQLRTLKLLQAEAFFSWEAFGSDAPLEFTNLTSLMIDFEKDHVANDSHKYDAQKGGKNPRVSMGIDKRRILFPKLTNLCVRKLPYTYPEAWAMFLDSPIKNLALAGKFAHIRYLDTRVLRQLDIFDMHVYLSEKSFGKFTAFVKTVLSVASSVKSAWIRHSEIFPISAPEVCAWTGLQELNITAYIPTFTLLALVSQLPELRRLIAQRIACDDSEAPLEADSGPFHVEPGAVASTSVRNLQLHMGGSKPRVTTLQTIIYVVLCMPRLKQLAVKQAYRKDIRLFIRQHGANYPELLKLDYVHHINMKSVPAQLL
ncbi:hypothetical protein GGH94_005069 [Coemansia aciculifera]|uniref:Uncharacterized protein n=1 Tax=Coemansia aciculifera TaxID=417176 RepID=A0A9W8IE76_9FUNG|nr:hypothetical protein GGH94_005069 [Coemansia aciculifera]KAJ2870761.1 hypothetical protein GGH93_005328 [Coemansia aciculifera]